MVVKSLGRWVKGDFLRGRLVRGNSGREGGRRGKGKKSHTYVENRLRSPSTGICIFFTQRDQFLGQPLRFFGFMPCCGDGFVLEEGGDEVAEEGLSVGGGSA